MSFSAVFSFLRQSKSTATHLQNIIFKCNYAAPAGIFGAKVKKGKKSAAASSGKIVLPVETDVKKLLSHCCGTNILKEGEDIKLKDDSEYPDWLWNIRTGDPPKLDELDPNTKAYWRKLRTLALRRHNRLSIGKKF